MATGSFAAIASYNGTGTQGLAVLDKIDDEDEEVISVFWNKTDTDKQILHGSNFLEIPTSTSTKQGTWGGSQTFSVNRDIDCIGDIYLALNVDFNIPDLDIIEDSYPKTITTLLQKPSDPNHEFLNNTQPVGYALRGIKEGDTEPKSSIIGYQQGFKRDESISYDSNGIPSAYSQNGYPNRGDGDDEHWMELPIQRKTLKGLRTYYDTNPLTGEEPNELVNTGIISKSDSVHMTTVDSQVNQPHDNSGNILEGFNNWINTSLIKTANDNHLSNKVTDGPPPGRFPGVLTEEDANIIKHTGNEFLALDENGEFEIYTSDGVVASDLFKSYLNKNDTIDLVNYYNDNTTRSHPLETLNETTGLQDGEVKSITKNSFSINDQPNSNTDFNGECVAISEDGNTMAVGQGFTISRDGLVTAGIKDVSYNNPWTANQFPAEVPLGTWTSQVAVISVPIGHYMKRPDNLSIDDTIRHIGKVRVYKKKKGVWVISGVLHPPKSTFTPPKRPGINDTIVPGPQNGFSNGNTIFTDPSANGMTLEWTGKNQHSSVVNPDLSANTPADLNAESTNFAGFTQGGLHGFTNNKYISINADGTRIVVAESNKNSGAPYNGWSGTFDYTETDGWKFINEGYVGRYSRADMDYKGIPGAWDVSLSGDGNSLVSLDLRALSGNTLNNRHACAPIELIDYETWKLGGTKDFDKFLPGDYDYNEQYSIISSTPGGNKTFETPHPTQENPQHVHNWKWAWFITEYGRRHRWDSNYDVNRDGGVKTHSLSKSWARASLERILDSKTVPFSDFIRMRPRIGHRILQAPEETTLATFMYTGIRNPTLEMYPDIPRSMKSSNSGYMNSISFKDNYIKPSNPYEPSLSNKEDFDTPRNAINTENQTNNSGVTFPGSTIPFNHYAYFKEAEFPGGGSDLYRQHPCNVWIRYWDPTNHGPNKDNIGGIGYNDSDRINGWVNHKVDYIKDSGLFGRGDKDIWHQYIYRKMLNFDDALKEHYNQFISNGGSLGYTGTVHDFNLPGFTELLGLSPPDYSGYTWIGGMAQGANRGVWDIGYLAPGAGDINQGAAPDLLRDILIPSYGDDGSLSNPPPSGYGEKSNGNANQGYYGHYDPAQGSNWPTKNDVHDMNVNPDYTFNRMSEFQVGIWDPSNGGHATLQNLDFKLPEIINLYIRNTYIAGEPERWAAKSVKMSSDGNRIVYITDAPTPVDRRSLPLETYSTASGAVGGTNSIGGQITDNPSWPTPANCEVRVIEKNSEGNWVYMNHSSGDMYSGLTVPAGHEAIDMTMSSDGNTVAVYSKRPNLYPRWAWEEVRRIENGKSFEAGVEEYESFISYIQSGSDVYNDYNDTNFGSSVALSGNGLRLIVGAPLIQEDGYNNTGMAYIYDWDPQGAGSWVQLGSQLVGPGDGALFGTSVAINYDGSRIAIGSPNIEVALTSEHSGYTGNVRVYERVEPINGTGGGWNPLGNEWDISGAQIGGGQTEGVGTTISMNAAGDRILIGLPFRNSSAGGWKIYDYDVNSTGSWDQLWDSSGTSGQSMGFSVDLNDAGNRLIIGSGAYAPRVYEYAASDSMWNLIYELTDSSIPSTDSVSISGDGAVAAVGFSNYGHTYPLGFVAKCGIVMVFSLPPVLGLGMEFGAPSNAYTLRQSFIGQDLGSGYGEEIGRSVALNNDGTILSYGGAHYKNINSSYYPDTGSIRLFLWKSGSSEYKPELVKVLGSGSEYYEHIIGDPGDMIASANNEPSAPTSLLSANTLSMSSDGLTIAGGIPLKNPTQTGPSVGYGGGARVFKGLYNLSSEGVRLGSYSIKVYPASSGDTTGNVFYLNDELAPPLNFTEGNLYVFTHSIGYPMRFSTTPDGVHNGGVEYIPIDGTNVQPDSKGGIYSGTAPIFNISQAVPGFAHTVIRAGKSMPTLYYYGVIAGMGNRITVQRAIPWIEPIPEDDYLVYNSYINDGLNDISRGVGEPAITLHSIVNGAWTKIGNTIYPEGYHDTGFRHRAVMGDRIGSETPVFESPLDFIDNHWKYPRMKYSLDLNSDGSRLVIGAPMNIPEDSGLKTIEYNVDLMSSISINPNNGNPFVNYLFRINDKLQPNIEMVKLNTYKFKGTPFLQQDEFKVTLTVHIPSTVPSTTPGFYEFHTTLIRGHPYVSDYPVTLPGTDSTLPFSVTSGDVFDSNHKWSRMFTFYSGLDNYFDLAKLETAGMNFSSEKSIVYLPHGVHKAIYVSGEFTKRTIVYLLTKDGLMRGGTYGEGAGEPMRNIDLSFSSWELLGQGEDIAPKSHFNNSTLPSVPNPTFSSDTSILTDSNWTSNTGWSIAYSHPQGNNAYEAFRSDYSSGWTGWRTTQFDSVEPVDVWLSITYPEPVILRRYTIKKPSGSYSWPVTGWKMQGSNDGGTSWNDVEDLHEGVRENWPGNQGLGDMGDYSVTGDVGYLSYRFVYPGLTDELYFGYDISELRLYTVPVPLTDPWKLYKKVYEAGYYEYEFNWDYAYHFYQESETQPIPPDPIIRFSTTPNGTNNSGVEYTKGVTIDLENNVTTIEVSDDTPTLYYYSSQNNRMDSRVTILERTAKNSSDYYRTFNGVDEYIVPCGEVLVYDKTPDNTYILKNIISEDKKNDKSNYSTKILTDLTGDIIPYSTVDSNGDILPHSPYTEGTTTVKTSIEYIGNGQDSGYRFGSSVSISGDGNTISIGAPETGIQTVDGNEVISGTSNILDTFTYTATPTPTPGPKKNANEKFANMLDVFNLINNAQKRSNHDITDFSNLPDIGNPISWKKQFKEVPEGAVLPPELDEYDNPHWADSNLKSKVTFPLSRIIKRIEFKVGTQIWQLLEHDDILAINATELSESAYKRSGLQSYGFLRGDGTRESTKNDNWIPGKSYQAVIPLPLLTKTVGGQLENFTQNTEDGFLSFLAKEQEVKIRIFYSDFEDIWDVNNVLATKGFTAPIYNLENKQRGVGQYITNAPYSWNPNAILTSKLFGKHFIMTKNEKEYFNNISNKKTTGGLGGLGAKLTADGIIPKRVKTSQSINKIFPSELYPDNKIIIDLDNFSLYCSHLIITSNFPSFSDKTKIPVLKNAELFLNSKSFSGVMDASILKGITNKSLGLYSNEFTIDNLNIAAGNEYYVFPLASRAFSGSSILLDRFDNIRLELTYDAPGLTQSGINISKKASINVTCRGEILVTYKDGISTIKLY